MKKIPLEFAKIKVGTTSITLKICMGEKEK